jgi:hypothetical protein
MDHHSSHRSVKVTIPPVSVGIAHLQYDAASERISGWIGTEHFNERAFSGGSRGHKTVGVKLAKEYLHDQENTLQSRLSTTGEKKDAHGNYLQRGGTIPPGHYTCHYIEHHKSFKECIRLDPTKDAYAIYSPFASMPIYHHRGGFYIHGHGPKGSDGCLVPESEHKRRVLNQAIKNFKGVVVLEVIHVSYMLPAEQFEYNSGPMIG